MVRIVFHLRQRGPAIAVSNPLILAPAGSSDRQPPGPAPVVQAGPLLLAATAEQEVRCKRLRTNAAGQASLELLVQAAAAALTPSLACWRLCAVLPRDGQLDRLKPCGPSAAMANLRS